jgi:gamma-glutamyltranspeptidase/glutathione hydrolase
VSRTKGAVAAGHPATAQAACELLEAGGNAFDAALAALCAACVAEPVLASLGGGGFLLAKPATSDASLYDFFTQTPGRRGADGSLDFFPITADFGPAQQEFHIGRASIAVPGAVAGLFAVHRDLCSLPMSDIVAPAIELARRGVMVEQFQSYLLGVVRPIFDFGPDSRAIYRSRTRPDRLLQPGEILHNPELGDLLAALAQEGEDLFYRTVVAESIVALCRDGGNLTATDLAGYRVVRRPPLTQTRGDVGIATNPPPSSGGILIAFALALWEQYCDRRETGLADLVAVMKATEKARIDSGLATDPDNDRVLRLLDPNLIADYAASQLGRAHAARGTTHISVIDGAGNAAGLTVSNGEGCGHLIPGTGTMLNNMLGEEDINPTGFHQWRPDTRMSSMMAPSLLQFADGRTVVLGSGGSNRIRTAVFQVMRHLVEGRLSLAEAVAAPRLHFEAGHLDVEPGFGADEIGNIVAGIPDHRLWDESNMFFGGVHAVEHDVRQSRFGAVGDPRRAGAVAYPGA